jgi:chromosome segregation ATPase
MNRNDRNEKAPYEISNFLKQTNFGAALERTPESIWAVLVHTAKQSLHIENEGADPLTASDRNLKGTRFFRNLNIVKVAFRLLRVEFNLMEVLLSKDKAERVLMKMIRFGRFQSQVNEALAPTVKRLKEREGQLAALKAKTQADQRAFDQLSLAKQQEHDKYKEALKEISHVQDETERKRTVLTNLEASRQELVREVAQMDQGLATSALEMKSLAEEIQLLEGQVFENTAELRALLQQKESEFQSKSNRLLTNAEKEEITYKNNLAVIEAVLKEMRVCLKAADSASTKLQLYKDRRAELDGVEQSLETARQELATLKSEIDSCRNKSENLEREREEFLQRVRVQITEEEQETARLQVEIDSLAVQQRTLQTNQGEANQLLDRGYQMIAK